MNALRVVVALIVLGASGAAGWWAYLERQLAERITPPPVAPINVFALYYDVTPTPVMTTPHWQKVALTVPRWEFLSDHRLWMRMHFEDWDRLPDTARAVGLQRLLGRYGWLATDRRVWRTMSAHDWDVVPQPIRAMAIVGMIESWVANLRVGEQHGLDPGEVLRTVKAIAMSESWFNHRSLYVNGDGSADIGLSGASDFARRTIRRWHEQGWSPFTMSDEDYYNPWLSARFLAFWFNVMLDEADGDLELAVRAYNWGIGRARAGAGEEYLATVLQRRRRYFEGPSRSPTWTVLSQLRRGLIAIDSWSPAASPPRQTARRAPRAAPAPTPATAPPARRARSSTSSPR